MITLRKAPLFPALVLFFLLLPGCGSDEKIPVRENVNNVAADEVEIVPNESPGAAEIFPEGPDPFIDSLLNSMTLFEKVSHMMFPALQPGVRTKDWLENRHFQNYKPGGFVLFGSSMRKTAEMIREMQAISKIPLMFAEDFERGVAMRINGSKTYPFNMALGAAGSPQLVYEMGKRIAADSKILGVHWNLSPVADVNNNPGNPIINVRSFGESPELAGELSLMMVRGLQAGGMLSSLKHFPGHGNTTIDSHSDLAVIHGSKKEFLETEIKPFKVAIDGGAYTVMVGHLGVEAYNTSDTAATLSHSIISGLLRNELGFKGIVNTDAMSMKAISKYYKPGIAAVLTVKAGTDVIMASPEPLEGINAIMKAIKRGEITEERIDRSVRKILQAKRWAGVFEPLLPLSAVDKLFKEKEIDEISKDLAIRSITLLKTDDSIFPFDKKKKYFHLILRDGRDFPNIKRFKEELNKRNSRIETYDLPPNPDRDDLNIYEEKIANYNEVIVSVYLQVRQSSGRINLTKDAAGLINALKKKGKKVIVLAHSHPYILMDIPNVDVFVTNYGAELSGEMALAAAVFGENNISGKLPVSLPGTPYKFGTGIDLLKERGKTLGLQGIYDQIDELVMSGIRDSVFPGAAITVIKDGKLFYENSYGRFTYEDSSPEVKLNSLFDIASLTKVTATTFAVMKLYEEGNISLDSSVGYYMPEFRDKPTVTVRSILLHNSGLPASKIYYKLGLQGQQIIDDICNTPLEYKTGSKTVYSDLGMIILGKVVERVTGEELDDHLRRVLWAPAGMSMTRFNPDDANIPFCVPTEIDDYWRFRLVQGTVHDENCTLLGGISGHAGIFSTVQDVGKFMLMLLNGGLAGGEQLIKPATIATFLKRGGGKSSRALGWDTNFEHKGLGGKKFPVYSFGHTGFTGTSIWADPVSKFALILFTNRVHPTRDKEGMKAFRLRYHEALASLLLHK